MRTCYLGLEEAMARPPAPPYKEQPMDEMLWQRVTVDPEVMVGKPVIRGTRIPVELIVRMLSQGIPEADILREYPRLQPEDIRGALAYAARVLAQEEVFPLSTPAWPWKTMPFVVDESAGVAVVGYLRTAGHDVVAVAEAMPQADDHAILSRAMSEGRILVTNDKDFGELVFRRGQGHHGVVLLRLHDESSANRVRIMRQVLERYANRLSGNFTVATETSFRIRPPRPSSWSSHREAGLIA
jgi:uncharacterized protein (DUF433 family)/predicted nuclease of predicted toxin-antitoxin system